MAQFSCRNTYDMCLTITLKKHNKINSYLGLYFSKNMLQKDAQHIDIIY